MLTGRDETLGAAAEERLAPLGAAKFLRADAGDPDQARASVDQAVALLGGLDILVNNAGVGVQAGVLETPLDSYDLVMDVNVRGAFVYAQAAFPHLEARGGTMLHVASDAGVMGEEDIGIYSVSKAALDHAVEHARDRGRPSRRPVQRRCARATRRPGCVIWVRPDTIGPRTTPSDWIVPPLGRVGLAIDVAEAAVYLCSARARLRQRRRVAGRRRDARRHAHRPSGRTVDSSHDGHDRAHLRSAPRIPVLRAQPHEPGHRRAQRDGARRGRRVGRSHDGGVPARVQGLARLRGADRGALVHRPGQPRFAQRRLCALRGSDRATDVEPATSTACASSGSIRASPI